MKYDSSIGRRSLAIESMDRNGFVKIDGSRGSATVGNVFSIYLLITINIFVVDLTEE